MTPYWHTHTVGMPLSLIEPLNSLHTTLASKSRKLGMYVLIMAMIVFAVDMILVVFFGGIRVDFPNFTFRSTTIEFPTIAFLISAFSYFILKGNWKESILIVVSLSLGCILGEGILRIVDHPWSKPYINTMSWFEPSDFLGFKLAPNFEGRGPLSSWVKTNSQGLRDVEHQWQKSPGVIRILGLGDSFTFGWGVSIEESFLRRLENKLQTMTGVEIETINAGVPIWGLNHYYVYLKEIGVRYSPDIIVLTYFINDIPGSIQEKIPADTKHQKGSEQKGGIFRSSFFFNFIKTIANRIRDENRVKRIDHLYKLDARVKEMAKARGALIIDSGPDKTQASSQKIKILLQKIQSLADQHNSRLIMMLVPDVAQLHQPELQHINRVLTSITKEMNIPFTDMTPVFESGSDPKTFYFWPQDIHTNAYGHEKMAEALTPLVCQALQQKNISCNQTKKNTNTSSEP